MHLRPRIVAAASWSLTRDVALAFAASHPAEIPGLGGEQGDKG
jgi:hypothetical protein